MDSAERSPEGIEHQVGDVIRQRAAHQKLKRQVIDALGVSLPVCLLGLEPTLREDIPHGPRNGFEAVSRRDVGRADNLIESQMPLVKGVAAAREFQRAAVKRGGDRFLQRRLCRRAAVKRAATVSCNGASVRGPQLSVAAIVSCNGASVFAGMIGLSFLKARGRLGAKPAAAVSHDSIRLRVVSLRRTAGCAARLFAPPPT